MCSVQSQFQTNKNAGIQIQCPGTAGATNPLFNINPIACDYGAPCSGGNAAFKTEQFTVPAIFKDHNAIANLDYVLNAKNTISTRYEYEEDSQYDGIASQDANTAVGVFLPGEPGQELHSNQDAVVRLTTVLTGNSVNQAIVSYQRLVTSNSELTPYTNSSVGISDLQPGLDQTLLHDHAGLRLWRFLSIRNL